MIKNHLAHHKVAISISESPNMGILGLAEEHLQDAMTETARHLLAVGAQLLYGGDLRAHGFTTLLLELVACYHREAAQNDHRPSIINYLAYPIAITLSKKERTELREALPDSAKICCLNHNGKVLVSFPRRGKDKELDERCWSKSLTQMRQAQTIESTSRIILGGKTQNYKGSMPGIAEETLLTLKARKPLFILGGFGGCTRDIAILLGLRPDLTFSESWKGHEQFSSFNSSSLHNGLNEEENRILAKTLYIDQAIVLILRGLLRLNQTKAPPSETHTH